MNPQGPEPKLNQAETKKTLGMGYTVTRIKEFTKKSIAPSLRKLTPMYDKLGTSNQELSLLQEVNQGQNKIERMVLTSMFLPQIWQKINKWITEHPSQLAESYKFGLGGSPIPIQEEEVRERLRNKNAQEAAKIIDEHLALIFFHLTNEWEEEQNTKQREGEPSENEEKRMWRAYKRYKEVVSMGTNSVRVNHQKATLIGGQIAGGFSTARHMILNSIGILPTVFELENNGRRPSKAELLNLIKGTKPLLAIIAHSDVETLTALGIVLGESRDIMNMGETLSQDFDPKQFWISRHGNNLYLEIKPEVLDEAQYYLYLIGHDPVRTGCPALAADGVDGKNIVVEMYDWFAKLYEKLYINNHPEFK